MTDQQSFAISLMDETFNPENTWNYGLSIIVSETSFSTCILDYTRNKFIGLYRCVRNELPFIDGQEKATFTFRDFLQGVFNELSWINNPFKTVKIAYDGKKSTLIPTALFDPNEKENYFNFNFPKAHHEMVVADHLLAPDAWQIYVMPNHLKETLRSTFPRCKVVHHSTLLIEAVWANYKNRINTPYLFMNVRRHLFDILIFDGRQLIFFNTFNYQNAEDITYYLVFVLEQLNYNPEKIPLVLLGDIEAVDGLTELLLRYVRQIGNGRKNDAYRYSYIFNQVPPHSWFTLFNFFSCGL